jgi:hypothetical protein
MAVTSGSKSDVAVDVMGFGQTGSGTFSPLPALQDTSPYSARSFVSVDSPTLHLEANQRQPFNAIIHVPQNVGDGGRYAIIYIHPAAGAGSQAFGVAVIVPVLLTIQGTSLTHTGSITDLQEVVLPSNSVQIQTTLKNTGNYHYYAYVNDTVTDSNGHVVATPFTAPSDYTLIPGNQMVITTYVSAQLAPGTYTVKSDAKLSDGTLLDTKTTTFTLSAPSAAATPAPAQQQTAAQTPGSGAKETIALQWTPPATPASTGPHKLWILPIYTPGPDPLITIGVLSAALVLLWGRRK